MKDHTSLSVHKIKKIPSFCNLKDVKRMLKITSKTIIQFRTNLISIFIDYYLF